MIDRYKRQIIKYPKKRGRQLQSSGSKIFFVN
jgi:hypothetical protein